MVVALTAGKFNLVKETQLPHICRSCGVSADGKMEFIDFGYSFDFEGPSYDDHHELGAFYLCIRCGQELARLLGYDTPENVQALKDEIEKLNSRLERVRNDRDSLVSRLANYDALFSLDKLDSVVAKKSEPAVEGSEGTEPDAPESVQLFG